MFACFAYHHGQVFVVSTDGRKKFPSSSIISCTCLLPEIELRFMTCSSEKKNKNSNNNNSSNNNDGDDDDDDDDDINNRRYF